MRKLWKASRAPLIATAIAVFGSTFALGYGEDAAQAAKLPMVPVFQEGSVHDPSVIKADGEYYVFGSHLAAAKSADLMSWTMIDSGVADGNKLIPNVTEELKETLDWAQSDTLWAADVIQLNDGRYYMYYNACKGDSPRSALGVAVADEIEGPYKDLGILLKSGMWGEPSEDGTIYDATVHPNVVDPDVFYDKDGQLWMVYGSYSGGIFILKMDPDTGAIVPGQGYGKKLVGGNHSRIEGPYILYSPETDYYYMFLSFGGLDAAGGYNIRVVRSANPDGPYVDAEGNDMIDVKADPSLPLFDDKSIEPYGVKLMGNYQWTRAIGDPGEGTGLGYVSPGHNSAYYDEATGKHFLIFHSRFPGRGEEHEIRVHEMHMNEDGWPVAAPYRYAGLANAKKVTASEAAGSYKLINHGKGISSAIQTPVAVRLNKGGTVTGDVQGTWSLDKDGKATLQLEGETYKGVFSREWDSSAQAGVLTFSALSSGGVAVWGSQVEELKDKEAVAAVKADLDLGDTTAVFRDMSLPAEGTQGTVIEWSSSNEAVVSSAGAITRPAAGEADAQATLTATIRKGKSEDRKAFDVTVKAQLQGPVIAQYSLEEAVDGVVTDSSGNGLNGALQGGAALRTDGKQGAALQFDGTDGYVELPGFVADAEDFTFASWVYWEGGGAWQRIFDFGSSLGRNMFLTPSSGSVQFTIHDGTDQSLFGTGPLPANEWTHVAVTIEGDTGKLYVNGELVATNNQMTFNPNQLQSTEAYLGKSRYAADPYLNGSLDEVYMLNKALTQEEIQALAES